MRKNLLIILVVIIYSCNSQEKRKLLGVSDFQKEMNVKFKDASKSPLTKRDLKKFEGLDFFKIDDKYKVVAKLTKTPDAPSFSFPTTTDRVAV